MEISRNSCFYFMLNCHVKHPHGEHSMLYTPYDVEFLHLLELLHVSASPVTYNFSFLPRTWPWPPCGQSCTCPSYPCPAQPNSPTKILPSSSLTLGLSSSPNRKKELIGLLGPAVSFSIFFLVNFCSTPGQWGTRMMKIL